MNLDHFRVPPAEGDVVEGRRPLRLHRRSAAAAGCRQERARHRPRRQPHGLPRTPGKTLEHFSSPSRRNLMYILLEWHILLEMFYARWKFDIFDYWLIICYFPFMKTLLKWVEAAKIIDTRNYLAYRRVAWTECSLYLWTCTRSDPRVHGPPVRTFQIFCKSYLGCWLL